MRPDRKTSARPGIDDIVAVRVKLQGSRPAIWRKVEVPTSITLDVLHDILQAVMGWCDCHLWELAVGGRKYGLPMDGDWGTGARTDARKVRLRDVLGPGKTVIDYVYDFGDYWQLRLTVSEVRPGLPDVSYPRYVGGRHNAPPEDCGGIPGFHEMLEALADPDDPDHAQIKEWAGDYDPDTVDERPIKVALGDIASRRNAAEASARKKQARPPG